MRKFGATEGDIRLRLGPMRIRNKVGFVLKSRARRLRVLESCGGGGGGVCLFTQRMNTRTPTATVVFFPLISQ